MFSPHDNLGMVDLQTPVNRQHPLARNRVAWWLTVPHLTGGPIWHDLIGLNPGTLTGFGSTTGWRYAPRQGGAGNILEAGSQRITCTKQVLVPSGGALTIAAWVRVDQFPVQYQTFVSIYQAYPGNIQYTFRYNNTVLEAYLRTTGDNFTSGGTTNVAGEWIRAACVYDDVAKTIAIYRNGKSDNTPLSYTGSPASSTATLVLGGNAVPGEYLNGAMDDIVLWNRALTAAEIKADYDLSRLGNPGLLNRIVHPTWAMAGAGQPIIRRHGGAQTIGNTAHIVSGRRSW
jgi:hypothetical protein